MLCKLRERSGEKKEKVNAKELVTLVTFNVKISGCPSTKTILVNVIQPFGILF